MKKLIIGLFVLATTATFGQIRKGNNVVIQPQFGIFGGLSVPYQTESEHDYYNSNDAIAGGIGGVSLSLPISYGWYIQPEVTYSNMGTQFYTDNGNTYADKVRLHMNYLSVPVLFKYQEPFTGIGVLFGPQYGYLLSANQHLVGNYQNGNDNQSENVKDYFKKSDFSGVVGLEYYFPNDGRPGPKFGFSARYQFGFLNVNKDGMATNDPNTAIRNNAFFLTAGIRF